MKLDSKLTGPRQRQSREIQGGPRRNKRQIHSPHPKVREVLNERVHLRNLSETGNHISIRASKNIHGRSPCSVVYRCSNNIHRSN